MAAMKDMFMEERERDEYTRYTTAPVVEVEQATELSIAMPGIDASKKQCIEIGKMKADELLNHYAPDEIYVLAYKLSLILSTIQDQVKQQALDLIDLDEKRDIYGVKVSVSTASLFSYDHCPAWKEAKERLSAIEGLMKSKARHGDLTESEHPDPVTGEIISLAPARMKPRQPGLKIEDGKAKA